jgi:hypothetical protein
VPSPHRRTRSVSVGIAGLAVVGLAASQAGAANAPRAASPSVSVTFPGQTADSANDYTVPAGTATTFQVAVVDDADTADTVTIEVGAGVPITPIEIPVSCGNVAVTLTQVDSEDVAGTTSALASGTQTLDCTATPATTARGTLLFTGTQTSTITATDPGVSGAAIAQVPKKTPYPEPQYLQLGRASTKSIYYATANTTGGGKPLQVLDGSTGDVLLGGDFDGSGDDYPVIYRPSNATFYISEDGEVGSDGSIRVQDSAPLKYGSVGDDPLIGNFDVENPQGGFDTVAVYRPSTQTFYVDGAQDTSGLKFGSSGDIPLVGNWTGSPNGDSIGVYRPSNETFYLLDPDTGTTMTTRMGEAGDKPVVGDWNGQGTTLIGVHRGDTFYLATSNTTGAAGPAIAFGSASDTATAAWSFTAPDLETITGDTSAARVARLTVEAPRRALLLRRASARS